MLTVRVDRDDVGRVRGQDAALERTAVSAIHLVSHDANARVVGESGQDLRRTVDRAVVDHEQAPVVLLATVEQLRQKSAQRGFFVVRGNDDGETGVGHGPYM